MSPPILVITNSKIPSTSVPNLLPCRIQHDGLVDQAATYWTPVTTQGPRPTKEAYLRGKKLKGLEVSLPDDYEGLVLQTQTLEEKQTMTNGVSPTAVPKDDKTNGSTTMQTLSRFEDVVVWSLANSGSDSADVYTRFLDEWLETANQIHSY